MGTYFYKLLNYVDLASFFDGGWASTMIVTILILKKHELMFHVFPLNTQSFDSVGMQPYSYSFLALSS